MKTVLITPPTIEPITGEELNLHLRSDDDTGVLTEEINTALVAGRQLVETITRRQLLTATWDYYLDRFPSCNYIKLPFGNLQNVSATQYVKYTDSDGDTTTMTVTTDYLWETNGENPGRVVLPYGVSWPSFDPYPSNPIVIRFVCGWTTRALLPSTIKIATKFAAEDIYYHGERHEILDRVINALLYDHRLWDEF